ncbi:sensor histidine kinase [Streptomyces sp. NPDC001262]|uniref:sensor histidine kinase n=1 Tax=Streptomyces TaxID=1883 RepID=UPI00368A3215
MAWHKALHALGPPGSQRRERCLDWLIVVLTAGAACLVLLDHSVASTGLVMSYPANCLIAVLASGTLFWRRSRPEICLSAGLLASLVSDERTVLAVGAYSVARYGGVLRFWSYGTAIALYLLSRTLTGTSAPSVQMFLYAALLIIVVPALFGALVRRQRMLNELLHRQLAQVEDSMTHAARFAALEQRTRLAFEVHDNAGHQATVLTLYAGALQQRTDLAPEARRIVDAMQHAAREVAHELRRVVDTLFAPEEGGERLGERIPCAEFLQSLTRNMAAVGMDIDYRSAGRPCPLPAETERLLRRISHEGLTNAAKHASGAPVGMTLTFAGNTVSLSVRTGPSRGISIVKDSGGLGLRGLRAAVAAAGGSFTAGPVPTGGFLLEATLPCQDDDVPAGTARGDDHRA